MGKILIKQGTLIPMDYKSKSVIQADILIEDTKIVAIDKEIQASNAKVIDASDMIVIPGFIDTHRHMWQTQIRGIGADWTLGEYLQKMLGVYAPMYRPQDVYIGNLLGALDAVNSGITTVFDWSHIMNTPDHTDEAIRGLWESGIRAVFAHGNPGTNVMEWFYESKLSHPEDVRRVRNTHFQSDDQRVSMAMAIRGPEYSSLEVTEKDLTLARELGLRASMHVGGGTFGPHYQAIKKLKDANLLGPDLNFAHCCTLSDEDFSYIAESGGSVSITPEVEMQMGLGLPATGKALRNGIDPGLGIDVVAGSGGDMFSQMKIALQTERALLNQQLHDKNEMPSVLPLTVYDALKMGTIFGAKTLGLEDKIGSLTPGKQADIVLIKGIETSIMPINNAIGQIVLNSGVQHVDTVLVAGKVLKEKGMLVGFNLDKIKEMAFQSRDSLFNRVKALAQV